MTKLQNFKILIILSPLVFLSVLSLDIYAPILPLLTKIFKTNAGNIQFTIGGFVIVLGVGQILIGPFSDLFGRKPIILLGLISYIIGSLICATSISLTMLIIGRIIQATGCAATLTTAYACVKDIYQEKAKYIYSILNATIIIVPLIAPILGALLNKYFDWQAIFMFLAFFGLYLLLYTKIAFTESHSKNKCKKIFTCDNFKIIISSNFLTFTILSTGGYCCFLAFFSISPYIIINQLNISTLYFSYYFAIMAIMISLTNLLAAKIIIHFDLFFTGLIGTCIIILSAIIMLICHVYGLSLINYMISCIIMGVGASCMLGAGTGGAIIPHQNTGFACALLGCIQYIISAILTTLMMFISINSTLPLVGIIIFLGIINLINLSQYNPQLT